MKIKININKLDEEIKKTKLTQIDFAKQCKISNNVLKNAYIKNEINITHLYIIARYLNKHLKDFV